MLLRDPDLTSGSSLAPDKAEGTARGPASSSALRGTAAGAPGPPLRNSAGL